MVKVYNFTLIKGNLRRFHQLKPVSSSFISYLSIFSFLIYFSLNLSFKYFLNSCSSKQMNVKSVMKILDPVKTRMEELAEKMVTQMLSVFASKKIFRFLLYSHPLVLWFLAWLTINHMFGSDDFLDKSPTKSVITGVRKIVSG